MSHKDSPPYQQRETLPRHALGIEAANVAFDAAAGVRVDDLLRTSNPDVFAVGDCVAGTPRLTHAAGEMAKLAVQNALFGGALRGARASSSCGRYFFVVVQAPTPDAPAIARRVAALERRLRVAVTFS